MILYLVIFATGIAAHAAYVRFVNALRQIELDRLNNADRDERAFSA